MKVFFFPKIVEKTYCRRILAVIFMNEVLLFFIIFDKYKFSCVKKLKTLYKVLLLYIKKVPKITINCILQYFYYLKYF